MRKCASKKRRGSKTRQRTRRLRGGSGSESSPPPPAPPYRTNSASSTGSILPRIPNGTVRSPVNRRNGTRSKNSVLRYPSNNRARNGRVTSFGLARTPSGGTVHDIGRDLGPDRVFGDPARFSTSTPYANNHRFYEDIGLNVKYNQAWTNPGNKGSAQVNARREIAELRSDPAALTKSRLVPPPGPYGVRLRTAIASIATLWEGDIPTQTTLRAAVNAGDRTTIDLLNRLISPKNRLTPAVMSTLKMNAENAAKKATTE